MMEMMDKQYCGLRLSRREFVRVTTLAGGGLLIGVLGTACGDGSDQTAAPRNLQPDAFLRLSSDDAVTVMISKSEMGQGVTTALALMVAEELGARWDQVRFERVELDDERYGEQATGGSSTVRLMWAPLRRAGAVGRALLEAAAADVWGAAVTECVAEDGQVRHRDSDRRVRFSDLLPVAATLPLPESAPLRKPAEFRLIGRRQPQLEVEDIVIGRARFGIDVRVPGMRFATVARAPWQGAKLKTYDATAARAIPGVVNVVEVPATGAPYYVRNGVAVVASDTWSAIRARDALAIQWDEEGAGADDSSALRAALLHLVARPGKPVTDRGNAPELLDRGGSTVDATYELPFLSQAQMEPLNCTALVDRDRCTLWSPCQFPNLAASGVADALGIPAERVRVHVTRMGGGFGRRINADYAIEAALVSRAAGAPVQVVWTREDDFGNGFYRPMMVHRLEAALDETGYPIAIRHRVAGAPQAESAGISYHPYRCPNFRSESADLATTLKRGFWRAVSHSHTAFAIESFVDELANAAGRDPIEYRLDLIDGSSPMPLRELEAQGAEHEFDPERLQSVLKLVRERSGWDSALPQGRYRGVACHWCMATYVAEVVELSMTDGEGYVINRVTAVVDCGIVVNPEGAVAQVEGGIIDALSAARYQEITVSAGRVQQRNYNGYRLSRISDAPQRIDVHFVPSGRPPSGLGEPPVPPAAAALANALHSATGRRFRRQPFDGEISREPGREGQAQTVGAFSFAS